MEQLEDVFDLDYYYASRTFYITEIAGKYYFSTGAAAPDGLDNLEAYDAEYVNTDPKYAKIKEISYDYKLLYENSIAAGLDHAVCPFTEEIIARDDTGKPPEVFFLNAFYKGLMTLDGVYDAGEALALQITGNPDGGGKPSEKALLNAAKKHGFTGLTAIEDYNAAVMARSFGSLLDRTSAYGSFLMSAFEGMLYYFRSQIGMIVRNYLRSDSATHTGRGRFMTNFEYLLYSQIIKTESEPGSTGVGTGTSYMAEIIRREVMGTGFDPD